MWIWLEKGVEKIVFGISNKTPRNFISFSHFLCLTVFIGGCDIKNRSALPVFVDKLLLEFSKVGWQNWPYHWHRLHSAQGNTKTRGTDWLESQACDSCYRIKFFDESISHPHHHQMTCLLPQVRPLGFQNETAFHLIHVLHVAKMQHTPTIHPSQVRDKNQKLKS